MSEDALYLVALPEPSADTMSMGTWMATEGGRKCPQCGRYARREEIGWTGFNSPKLCLDMYGHMPGFGCNQEVRP